MERGSSTFEFPAGQESTPSPGLPVLLTSCLQMPKRERGEATAQCDLSKAKEAGQTKWLKLETLKYTDETGVERGWDRCVRTTKAKEGAADGVLVIATLKNDPSSASSMSLSCSDQIVLVKQFRPATGSYTLEFPAGLIDAVGGVGVAGETEEGAAVRELKEECGFAGIATGKSVPLTVSPGMSNESDVAVIVEVDMALPENKNPVNFAICPPACSTLSSIDEANGARSRSLTMGSS
eukprot:3345829-Rhodomonas_salina.2